MCWLLRSSASLSVLTHLCAAEPDLENILELLSNDNFIFTSLSWVNINILGLCWKLFYYVLFLFCFFNVKLSEETNTDNKQCFAKGKCHQTTFRSLSCIIYFNYSLHAATGQEFPPGVNEGSICCNTAERQQLQMPNRKLLLSLRRDKADKQGSLKGE